MLVLVRVLVVGLHADDLQTLAVVAQTDFELERLGRLEPDTALDVEAGALGVAELDGGLLDEGVVLRDELDANFGAVFIEIAVDRRRLKARNGEREVDVRVEAAALLVAGLEVAHLVVLRHRRRRTESSGLLDVRARACS